MAWPNCMDIGFQLYDFYKNDGLTFATDDFEVSKVIANNIHYVYLPNYEEFVVLNNGKLQRFEFVNDGNDQPHNKDGKPESLQGI